MILRTPLKIGLNSKENQMNKADELYKEVSNMDKKKGENLGDMIEILFETCNIYRGTIKELKNIISDFRIEKNMSLNKRRRNSNE